MEYTPEDKRRSPASASNLTKESEKRTGAVSSSRREAFLGSDTKKKNTQRPAQSTAKRKTTSGGKRTTSSAPMNKKKKPAAKKGTSAKRRTFTEDARARASAGGRSTEASGKKMNGSRKPVSSKKNGTGKKRSYSNAAGGRKAGTKTAKRGNRPSTARKRPAAKRRTPKQSVNKKPFVILAFVAVALIAILVGAKYYKSYRLKQAILQAELEVKEKNRQAAIKEASDIAAGYDYDTAIEKAKAIEGYDTDEEIQALVKGWESQKENLVGYTAKDVTHIFYHTLVVEPDLAFGDAPAISNGFKQWMTTVTEFNKITQKMYDDGYVLVGLYDLFEENIGEDGSLHITEKTVYLPKDKKPFVLSLDDLSYYHTYTDHGMASKLVLDKNGKITCEYKQKDGTVVTGSYDCVPLINDFMTEHPDGAYRGARGTIALTGYNGVFGYRTDSSYVTKKDLDADKAEWLKDNPDFDFEAECEQAKIIADELKAEGWTFASHTWGHLRVGRIKLKKLKEDTEKWLTNVVPIIGKTDCIIFAHGQDMSPNGVYDGKNKKYVYLKNEGFNVFLNVDSHQYTMEVHDTYVHGGRRNLDGYRLWEDAHGYSDWTSDLFDASDMIDPARTDMPDVAD